MHKSHTRQVPGPMNIEIPPELSFRERVFVFQILSVNSPK